MTHSKTAVLLPTWPRNQNYFGSPLATSGTYHRISRVLISSSIKYSSRKLLDLHSPSYMYLCSRHPVNRAVRNKLFTALVLCQVSYEYLTRLILEVTITRVIQNIRIHIK